MERKEEEERRKKKTKQLNGSRWKHHGSGAFQHCKFFLS
jgi:hypothetical protein